MRIRSGAKGMFYGCNSYPACRGTVFTQVRSSPSTSTGGGGSWGSSGAKLKARFPGRCTACGSEVEEGDPILYAERRIIGCPACAPAASGAVGGPAPATGTLVFDPAADLAEAQLHRDLIESEPAELPVPAFIIPPTVEECATIPLAAIRFDEHQTKVVQWRRGEALVAAAAGCHRRGQGLLMYDGTVKAVEDVQVGDVLMGPDSRARTVLQLIRGRGDMAQVVPTKGAPFVVNLDHVLTVQRSSNKNRADHKQIADITVRDHLMRGPTWQKEAKLIRRGVTWAHEHTWGADTLLKQREVDPYFLGMLLGDGSFINGVSLCKPGVFVQALATQEAARWGLKLRTHRKADENPIYVFSIGRGKGIPRDEHRNPLIEALRRLDLYKKRGADKFVPDAYRRAGLAERKALLAGLLDADGHIAQGCVDFINISRQLAEDVAFMARSVGLAAYLVETTKADQHGTEGTYWRVSISGDLTMLPFRRLRPQPRQQVKDVLCTSFKVEPLDQVEDYFGFTLDGDGRYLLDDFTVTPNSGKSTVLVERLAGLIREGCPPEAILTLVYNRSAADGLRDRLKARLGGYIASRVGAYTFHGWAYTLINSWFPGRFGRGRIVGIEDGPSIYTLGQAALNAAGVGDGYDLKELVKISELAREALINVEDQDSALELISHLPHEPSQVQAQEQLGFIRAYQREKAKANVIDFADMLYIVTQVIDHGGYRSQALAQLYTHVQVDECFPGATPILLADGSTKAICEIAESQEELPSVLSYDVETKRQVIKRVIGVKRTLLQKPTVRIVTRRVGYGANGKRFGPLTEKVRFGLRFLVTTEDHRLFRSDGSEVHAGEVQVGDRLHLESAAPQVRTFNDRYKHSVIGRRALSTKIAARTMERGINRKGPPVRGGNGTGLTTPQRALLEALGSDWQAEYVVSTNGGRRYGLPTAYKIDIAHPGCRIAIELDGKCHQAIARREADERKDEFLYLKGWRVFRFDNVYAVRNAKLIASQMPKACPVEAEVISVEAYPIKDYYVYDLSVEDTHTYYANGLLVHNCQDINPARLKIATHLAKGARSLVMVGDARQCQPAGTKVLTPNGEQNIEDLYDGNEVCAWVRNDKTVQKVGSKVRVGSRYYTGRMVHVQAAGKETVTTANHRWLARWSPAAKDLHAVYVMRKNMPMVGDCFRVGWCKIIDESQGVLNQHFKTRARLEGADAIWLVRVCRDRAEASAWESIYSVRYQLPTVMFKPNGIVLYNEETLWKIWTECGRESFAGAHQMFTELGLELLHPLWVSGGEPGRKTLFVTAAANLCQGMQVPVFDEKRGYEWHNIQLNWTDVKDLPVYSLDVETHHAYVADGICTLNSVYGFTGSRPDLFIERLKLPGVSMLTLPVNRRSTKAIVEAGNAIAHGADWNLGGACEPSPTKLGEAEEVHIWATETGSEEADAIAQEVAARVADGVPLATEHGKANYAALVRTNAQAADLECSFHARGLPCRILGSEGGVWCTTPGRELLAYLRGAEGHPHKDLVKVGNKPKRYLKRVIMESAIRQKAGFLDALSADRSKGARQFADDLRWLGQMEWADRVKAARNFLLKDLQERGGGGSTDPDDDKVATYCHLAEAATVLGSLEAIDAQIERMKKVKKQDPAVEISTMHRSKGAEWHTVFVCGAAVGLIPHQKARDIEEEKRLFYVAVTRGQAVVVVSVGGAEPSPFVRALRRSPDNKTCSPSRGDIATGVEAKR